MSRGAIDVLLAAPSTAAADAFLAHHRPPIVEDGRVTFVWRGHADQVYLRHWIYGLEVSNELIRVPHCDVWYLVMEIPPGSRVEYKFDVRVHGKSHWMEDPLNPRRARDPFGANSVLQTAGYEVPDWTEPDPTARPGRLEAFRLHSEAFGGERGGQIYLPARMRPTRRYPLLVVHDGSDYLRYAGMKTVLDNLIHRLEIPELICVFSDSPDRLTEYADDPRHARFVNDELLGWLQERYPLRRHPASRCLMGASFGAVAALATAAHTPGHWGRLLLQSGSFAFTEIGHRNRRGPVFDRVVAFVNAYRAAPSAVSERIFMSCGTYESLIYENRSMAPLLRRTGMQVKLVEARDGHNWENWRDRLRAGLSWLMPGPLMFVYE